MKFYLPLLRQTIFCCLCILFFSAANVASAQTDTTQVQEVKRQRWLIETKDGSTIQGIFLGQDESGVRLMTESVGEVKIPAANIKSFKILNEDNFKDGVYWFENPNATRYFFSPSAFSLKKGEAYYQNTYLVLNSFNYGITDNFTIGGGFELISFFTDTENPSFFITPKYSFPLAKNLRAGVGLIAGISPIFSDHDSGPGFGIGYGVLTYGNLNNNATVGLGYSYTGGSFSSKPIITFSGMARISRKVGLVTENWVVPFDEYNTVVSYGLRFMGEKITVDLGFLNHKEIVDTIVIGIPYVDFVVKFGK